MAKHCLLTCRSAAPLRPPAPPLWDLPSPFVPPRSPRIAESASKLLANEYVELRAEVGLRRRHEIARSRAGSCCHCRH